MPLGADTLFLVQKPGEEVKKATLQMIAEWLRDNPVTTNDEEEPNTTQ